MALPLGGGGDVFNSRAIIDHTAYSRYHVACVFRLAGRGRERILFLEIYIENSNKLNLNNDLLVAIITPDKDIIPGSNTYTPAYLIYENYEKILNWNRSLRFALAVCTLKENFKNEI